MQGCVEEGLLGPGEDGEAATVLPASAEQQDLLAGNMATCSVCIPVDVCLGDY